MDNGEKDRLKAKWEHAVPSLDSTWTHWWLDGDGGLIGVTDDLAELKKIVEENYERNLKIQVFRARFNSEGDLVAQKGYSFSISNYINDWISKRSSMPNEE